MNDAFAQIIDPILRHVLEVRHRAAEGDHPALEEVRAELQRLFGEAEQRAAVARDTSANFALARYALVYWADEVLINSAWAHAEAWRNHILEWDYYRENLGGEKFFEKADEAERLADTDPLEVFFTCVALGFQGRLGFSKTDLRRWVERAYARIAGGASQTDRFLPDDDRNAFVPLEPLPGKARLLLASALVSATALATLAGYIAAMHIYY
jgi:type VI secretion system protein ImpK